MVVCKITCPHCGTDHEIDFSILNTNSILECNVCNNEFSLNNPSEEKREASKPKAKKSLRSSRRVTNPAMSGRNRRAGFSKQSSGDSSTKMVVTLFVFGLGLILVGVLALKIFGTGPKEDTAKKPSADDDLRSEIAALKKQIKDSNKTKPVKVVPLETENKESDLVGHTNADELIQEDTVENPEEEVPQFAKPSSYEDEGDTAPSEDNSDEEEVDYVFLDENQGATSDENEDFDQPEIVNYKEVSKKIILIPSEQAELDELSKLRQDEITGEEEERLSELKSKYTWYKANRYKMSREDMDYAWEKRWAEILASNKLAQSRSDALLPRPLQILLEKAKTKKERFYFMRIYQKPISFEEKEMVRKARNQAIWEKRKQDGPKRFTEDAKKKRNETYVDEYGYEYYLNEKGERVYL